MRRKIGSKTLELGSGLAASALPCFSCHRQLHTALSP
jgi:hypothetical protein